MDELAWALDDELRNDWNAIHDTGGRIWSDVENDYSSFEFSDENKTGTTRFGAVVRFLIIAGPWAVLDIIFMVSKLE